MQSGNSHPLKIFYPFGFLSYSIADLILILNKSGTLKLSEIWLISLIEIGFLVQDGHFISSLYSVKEETTPSLICYFKQDLQIVLHLQFERTNNSLES